MASVIGCVIASVIGCVIASIMGCVMAGVPARSASRGGLLFGIDGGGAYHTIMVKPRQRL